MTGRRIWVNRDDRLLLRQAIDEMKSAQGLLSAIDMRGYGGKANADTKNALLDLRSDLAAVRVGLQSLIDESDAARLAAFKKDQI